MGDRGLCPGSGEGGGGRMAVLCSPERCSIGVQLITCLAVANGVFGCVSVFFFSFAFFSFLLFSFSVHPDG